MAARIQGVHMAALIAGDQMCFKVMAGSKAVMKAMIPTLRLIMAR